MSDTWPGQIDQLQQDIVDRLGTITALEGIGILYEKTHNIASAIEIALGKLGLCIVVTPPVCRATKPNMPGPYLDDATIDINVVENVLLNQVPTGTKKTASYIAEKAAHGDAPLGQPNNGLHHFVTRDQRCCIVSSILPVPDPQFRVYRVTLKTAFGLK